MLQHTRASAGMSSRGVCVYFCSDPWTVAGTQNSSSREHQGIDIIMMNVFKMVDRMTSE